MISDDQSVSSHIIDYIISESLKTECYITYRGQSSPSVSDLILIQECREVWLRTVFAYLFVGKASDAEMSKIFPTVVRHSSDGVCMTVGIDSQVH